MREQGRSEWLVQAIDDLVQGEVSAPPSPEFDDEDLRTLMRVARARLKVARTSAQTGIQYEGAIWRQVLTRLERYKGAPESAPEASRPDAARDRDIEELQEIIGLRRQVAARLTELAEVHRDGVWEQVEARITSGRRRVLPLFPGWHEKAAAPAARAPRRWPRFAALAAGLAVIAGMLGPVPATGFAHHPAIDLANQIGDFIGVSEGAAPPLPAAQPVAIKGIDVTAAQASELMRLPLQEPSNIPAGLARTSSVFYSQPLTSDVPGLFALTYASKDGSASLAIYQEAASGANLAAGPGAANGISLADGTPATYFEGGWQPAGARFLWNEGAAQTLVFQRDGVRTTVHYAGRHVNRQVLISITDGLRPAGTN